MSHYNLPQEKFSTSLNLTIKFYNIKVNIKVYTNTGYDLI